MSFISELNESHDSVKGLALNLLLIPFWYVAIFIFNNEFYKSADITLIFAMCIVISFTSSVLFTIFLDNIYTEVKEEKTFFENMVISIAMLIIWISALIFIVYSLGFLFKIYIYFYWFIVIYFMPIIILNILQSLFGKKADKKVK